MLYCSVLSTNVGTTCGGLSHCLSNARNSRGSMGHIYLRSSHPACHLGYFAKPGTIPTMCSPRGEYKSVTHRCVARTDACAALRPTIFLRRLHRYPSSVHPSQRKSRSQKRSFNSRHLLPSRNRRCSTVSRSLLRLRRCLSMKRSPSSRRPTSGSTTCRPYTTCRPTSSGCISTASVRSAWPTVSNIMRTSKMPNGTSIIGCAS